MAIPDWLYKSIIALLVIKIVFELYFSVPDDYSFSYYVIALIAFIIGNKAIKKKEAKESKPN